MARSSPRVIAVEPGSAFDDVLDLADDLAVVELVRDGRRYRLESIPDALPNLLSSSRSRSGLRSFSGLKEDLLKDYDPERLHEALHRYAGSWADLEADEMIANIYRWREEGSREPSDP